MKGRFIFLSWLILCLGPFSVFSTGEKPEPPPLVSRRVAVMGTWAMVEVTANGRATAAAAAEAAVRALEAADRRLSTWSPHGALARLNDALAGREIPLDPRLARELGRVLRWWRRTDGAFNPAMGPLVRAWGLREGGRHPSPAALQAALEASDPRNLVLRGDRAVRRSAGLFLEEGAWGKGAALDDALEAARRAGALEVRLALGGQVLSSSPFRVEVTHPLDPGRVVATWALPPGSVATSGNGTREILHILDPRTGLPAPDFGSVSVWAPSALDADVLSTALYVMGPRDGAVWIGTNPGYRTLWITDPRGELRVTHVPPIDHRPGPPEASLVFRGAPAAARTARRERP